MQLPTELWTFIAYELKFELDLYKNVMFVNKQLYYVIKQLYDHIPEQLHIKTNAISTFYNQVPDKFIIKEYNNGSHYYSSLANASIIDKSITLHKNEILKNHNHSFKQVSYHGVFDYYVIIRLSPNKFFDKDFNQICKSIHFEISYPKFYVYYCEDK